MNLDKETIRKIRGLIVFTIVLLMAVWNYKIFFGLLGSILEIIMPFLIGGAIAFMLNVPMSFIEKKLFENSKTKKSKVRQKLSRPVSLVLTILCVIGLIALVVFIVVPQLAETFTKVGTTMQGFIPQAEKWLKETFVGNQGIAVWIESFELNWEKMLEQGISFFKNGAGNIWESTVSVAKSIINGVSTFFIGFVFACYILLQKEKLNIQVKKLGYAFLPKDWTEILIAISSMTYKTFSNFLTGQCLEAVILGFMFFIGMSIFRMPYALLMGVLIAFTALIPYFGAFIGCVVGFLLILMVNPVQAVGFLILFFVLQQIEGNLIYPHVVGGSVGLPSIWVLVAVSIGAKLMGIVGMLIFIPIVSVIYTLLRGIVNRRLKRKGIKVE